MILTYLGLSSHVTKETMEMLTWLAVGIIDDDNTLVDTGCMLQNLGWPAMTVAPYEYGAFVTCPCWGESSIEQLEALTADLLAVFRLAQEHGATVIRLDADGDDVNYLPTYAW